MYIFGRRCLFLGEGTVLSMCSSELRRLRFNERCVVGNGGRRRVIVCERVGRQPWQMEMEFRVWCCG